MKVKKVTKQEPYGYTRLIEQVVNHNAEVLEGALNRIKELEKRLNKEKRAGKLLDFEEFSKSKDITREEAIDMVRKAFAGWEDEFDTGEDWSKEHNARDMAIKALNESPKKGKWIEVDTNMYTCSNCSYCFEIVPEVNRIQQFKHCPNCGAEMESK